MSTKQEYPVYCPECGRELNTKRCYACQSTVIADWNETEKSLYDQVTRKKITSERSY